MKYVINSSKEDLKAQSWNQPNPVWFVFKGNPDFGEGGREGGRGGGGEGERGGRDNIFYCFSCQSERPSDWICSDKASKIAASRSMARMGVKENLRIARPFAALGFRGFGFSGSLEGVGWTVAETRLSHVGTFHQLCGLGAQGESNAK